MVIMTGSSGSGVDTNPSGADDAYPAPSGQSGSMYFSTNYSYTYPGGGGTLDDPPNGPGANDVDFSWDTTTAAIRTVVPSTDQLVSGSI